MPKIGEKTAGKIIDIAGKLASSKQVSIIDALESTEVVAKVPKDAKEDWSDLVDTLKNIAVLCATGSPAQVVEGAIGGWYQNYLRATYENWPRREEDLESLIDFATKYENLSEMLTQLVLLSSESGDRVIRSDERCLRLSCLLYTSPSPRD